MGTLFASGWCLLFNLILSEIVAFSQARPIFDRTQEQLFVSLRKLMMLRYAGFKDINLI